MKSTGKTRPGGIEGKAEAALREHMKELIGLVERLSEQAAKL